MMSEVGYGIYLLIKKYAKQTCHALKNTHWQKNAKAETHFLKIAYKFLGL